jgi:hypothetical protein
LAHLNSCWSKDVALFAIGVKEQGQSRIAMGVVVDRSHLGGYAVLVAAEINEAVQTLMTTTSVATSDDASVVAAFFAVLGHHKASFRLAAGDLTEIGDNAGACTGGVGAEFTDCHDDSDSSGFGEELDRVALR